MHSTKVRTNSKPMDFLLSRWIINWKYDHWIIILQDFDLEFVTPKSKKFLSLSELIYEFPTGTGDPLINDDLLNENLFSITSDDPWYGDILTYLRTQKFALHVDRDARRRIRHQASRYLLIGDDLYRRGIDTVLCHCLTHTEA